MCDHHYRVCVKRIITEDSIGRRWWERTFTCQLCDHEYRELSSRQLTEAERQPRRRNRGRPPKPPLAYVRHVQGAK